MGDPPFCTGCESFERKIYGKTTNCCRILSTWNLSLVLLGSGWGEGAVLFKPNRPPPTPSGFRKRPPRGRDSVIVGTIFNGITDTHSYTHAHTCFDRNEFRREINIFIFLGAILGAMVEQSLALVRATRPLTGPSGPMGAHKGLQNPHVGILKIIPKSTGSKYNCPHYNII